MGEEDASYRRCNRQEELNFHSYYLLLRVPQAVRERKIPNGLIIFGTLGFFFRTSYKRVNRQEIFKKKTNKCLAVNSYLPITNLFLFYLIYSRDL